MTSQSFGDIEWPPLLWCAIMLGVFPFGVALVLLLALLRLSLVLLSCGRLRYGAERTRVLRRAVWKQGHPPQEHILVVLMYGYSQTARSLDAIMRAIEEDRGQTRQDGGQGGSADVDILIPGLPATPLDSVLGTSWFGPVGIFSVTHPKDIVESIHSEIVAAVKARSYTRIVLVGHSIGAILMRNVYLRLTGVDDWDCGEESQPARNGALPPDGAAVPPIERLVLLSGTNRGFAYGNGVLALSSNPVGNLILTGLLPYTRILVGLIEALARRPVFFISHFRRGSVYVCQSRLDWLDMARPPPPAEPTCSPPLPEPARSPPFAAPAGAPPFVIQLAGSNDNAASPQDDIDLLVLDAQRGGAASEDRFVYRTILGSDHGSVLDVSDKDRSPGRERRGAVLGAIFDPPETLNALDETKLIASTEELSNRAKLRQNLEKATDVVFVVHGIRDYGFWTSKLARAIQKSVWDAANADAAANFDADVGNGESLSEDLDQKWHFRGMGSAYGFFGALPFLLAWDRQAKVEWFMDEYVTARAEFGATRRFHFVGHSNATFIAARALADYRFCRFARVVFAGSVVETTYQWGKILGSQVDSVLNYVATADLVVATFPKAFERFCCCFGLGLGGGGSDGFSELTDHLLEAGESAKDEPGQSPDRGSTQVKYIVGGHGAGIEDVNWKAIADFVTGATPDLGRGRPGQTALLVEKQGLGFLIWNCGVGNVVAWTALVALAAGPIGVFVWRIVATGELVWLYTSLIWLWGITVFQLATKI